MTNILFSTNADMIDATVTSTTAATGFDNNNIQTGSRREHYKTDAAGTSAYVRYEPATAKAANHYIVARADLCVKAQTTSFTVEHGSPSYSTYNATGSLSTGDLVGPNNQDYIYYNSTPSSAYDLWRLTVGLGSSDYVQLSKFYVGTALDIGREPDAISMKRIRAGQAFKKAKWEITLGYSGISYTNAMKVKSQIIDVADYHSIFIFTASTHGVLLGQKLIHCQVIDASLPQEVTNYNNIRLALRELL